jgi:hypothetical protein
MSLIQVTERIKKIQKEIRERVQYIDERVRLNSFEIVGLTKDKVLLEECGSGIIVEIKYEIKCGDYTMRRLLDFLSQYWQDEIQYWNNELNEAKKALRELIN